MSLVHQEAADFLSSLQQSDRLIAVTICGDSKPILIQQKLLEAASEWFTKALKRGTFIEGQMGKLDFPDDDREAWTIFLYWIFQNDFLVNKKSKILELKQCVKCWVFGDKYDIKKFQDEAMMQAIRSIDKHYLSMLNVADVNDLLSICPAGTPLARLLTEDLAWEFNERTDKVLWEYMERLNFAHLWGDFCKAQCVIRAKGWSGNNRLHDDRTRTPNWRDYMVGAQYTKKRPAVADPST